MFGRLTVAKVLRSLEKRLEDLDVVITVQEQKREIALEEISELQSEVSDATYEIARAKRVKERLEALIK